MTPPKEPKEVLLNNEERFRDLVDQVSDWIWEVNGQGVYTYASPRIQEILGYSPEEVVGKTPFDLMKPEEAERIRPLFYKLVTQKQPIKSLENINIHRDGHEVILETSGNPDSGRERRMCRVSRGRPGHYRAQGSGTQTAATAGYH